MSLTEQDLRRSLHWTDDDVVDVSAVLRVVDHRIARRRRARLTGVAAVVVVMGFMAGVQTVDDPPADLFSAMSGLNATASRTPDPYLALAEVLPNTVYRLDNTEVKFRVSDTVVVGTVESVRRGRAYGIPVSDSPSLGETDWDDPRANNGYRTVHTRVAVREVIAGRLEETTITVGFVTWGSRSFEEIEEGFLALDEVLLFLRRTSAVFDYDKSVFGTARDGSLIGLIGDDGRIELPALDDHREAELLRDAPTIHSLRDAAKQPEREIVVDAVGIRKSP